MAALTAGCLDDRRVAVWQGDVAEAIAWRAQDVTSSHRGDALAEWPCQGSAVLDVPAPLAAEFAPGGAVVEYVTDRTSRLRMGAWSWTGLAGLFLTFAADLGDVQPAELRDAFASISARIARIDPSA